MWALPGQSSARPASDPAKEIVCVPPGLPPFSTWQGGPARLFVAQDARGRPITGIQRGYQVRGRAINTFWLGNILVTVDPAPDDPRESGWHDQGAVNADTSLKDEPKQACDWLKAAPRTKDES